MARLRIVGQGLAGTVLAWRCLEAGVPFEIIDRGEPVTASSLAAGLVTPISGQRLHLAPDHDALRNEMEAFFEALPLGEEDPVYERRLVIRILLTEKDADTWAQRLKRPSAAFQRHHAPAPPLPDALHPGRAAFSMTRSGLLDVPRFLEASRRRFREMGVFTTASIDPEHLLHDTRSDTTVFCTGPWLRRQAPFDQLPLLGSQGDTLTLHIPGLDLPPKWILNAGCWLVPLGNRRFRAGSTYLRTTDTRGVPSKQGRAQLETRLERLLATPFTIEDHQAAVRPVTASRRILLGRHPRYPHLAVFAGLGSKGVLTAPAAARHLFDHLIHGKSLPPENDVRSHF